MAARVVSHYELLEKLGEGGMGVVYRARDLRLQRQVALKFLSSHLLDSEDARSRFFQEARAIAALNHPHIATLYEVAEGEPPFLALEYLPGGTLRSRLRDLQAAGLDLSLAEIVEYALQITAALACAHRNGIIHRDVKSENVMFTEAGALKITDFGLARSEHAPTLTHPGSVAGTVAYMAPERLQGLAADARADIFSLGVVLYEMATGRLPFQGETGAVLHQVVHTPTPPLRRLRPDLPEALERVVARATAKDREQRYQSMEELAGDLHSLREGPESEGARWRESSSDHTVPIPPPPPNPWRWAVLALVLCLAVVAGVYLRDWIREILKPDRSPPVHRLAVLPFTNVGDDPANQAFCDGLVETLSNRLTQLEQFQAALRVIPASEVREEGVTSTGAARRAFSATLVLSGSVQRSGKNVRLMVNLVDALTLEQLRSREFKAAGGDLWALQDGVVDLVTTLLELELRPAARDLLRAGGTRVGAAYELYVQGVGYLARFDKAENVDKAVSLFQKALREDPKYALAHAGLGEAVWRRYQHTKDRSMIQEAQRSATRALELNDRLAPLYVTRGLILAGTGGYEEAIKDFERALALDSGNTAAYRNLIDAYQRVGRKEAAQDALRKVIAMRPDWASSTWLGWFYYRLGRYDEAELCFRRMIELNPDDYLGYRDLGAIYYLMGRYDDAIAQNRRSIEKRPTGVAYSNLGTIYFFFQGKYTEAAQAYEKAVELGTVDHKIWGNLATAYLRISGPGDKSTQAYRRAVELAERDLSVNAKDADARASLAVYRARLGEQDRAVAEAQQARALAAGDVRVLFKAGLAFELAGKRDLAIDALKTALAEGYSASEFQRHPDLAGLRQDPRFTAPPPAPAGAPSSGRKQD